MKVRHQLILLIVLVNAGIAVLSVMLKVAVTGKTRTLLTQKLVEAKKTNAPKVLELNAAYISSYNFDYSVWDQAVTFIRGKQPANWGDNELKEPFANYKIDYVWVLDSAANYFYSTALADTLQNNRLSIPQQDLRNILEKEKSKTFFIEHNNAITEVFAGAITYTADKNRLLKPKGYLLLGRTVDSVYMKNLRNLSPEINFTFVKNSQAFADEIIPSSGQFHFSIPVNDFYNKPFAAFNISKYNPVLKSYQDYLNYTLLGFLGFVLLIGIGFYYFARRFFIKPLMAFSKALKSSNREKITGYLDKENEFGRLSALMNDFFIQRDKLEDEIQTRKKSEAELKDALEEIKSANSEKAKVEAFLGQQQAMLELNAQNASFNFPDMLRNILELAAKTIRCEKVSVWEYNDDISSIKSDFTYVLSRGACEAGNIAYEKDYPEYFAHLKTDALIIADDALTHAATKEFADDYLIPSGISSMLDVPIRSGKKVIGVLCCEHIGTPRQWTVNEQMYVRSLADIIAINYERYQRAKAEELLKKNHLRLEETQQLAKVGSWELSFINNEVIWSKEMYRIFELEGTPDDKIYSAFLAKLHPEDVEFVKESMESLSKNTGNMSFEARIRCRNGKTKYFGAIGQAILSRQQKKVIGLRGTVQDITSQKLAALAKSEFLSCMSHEIRTPINGVIGVTNLLMEEELTERQREYIRTLNFSAQHLSTVVSDILDFSKIESGHMSFEKVSFSLEKNCSYVFNLFANTAAEKGIGYNFLPAPVSDFSLYGDYVRLNQILSNLLSNAIKFTEKGRVDFSYKVLEDNDDTIQLQFCVKDTGIGIDENQQKLIFESFTQADESITRQYGGTGLGLTICKKLVELQGGKIELDSVPGIGSAFTFVLTYDKHVYNAEKTDITTAEKNQSKNLNGLKVLVAEDNKVNAMILTRFLKSWNAESKVAVNGFKVLELVEEEKFDLILMDIQMPEMNGIEATEKIRLLSNEDISEIPIVAFTADASVDTHRKLLKIGFDHCITKPFNPDALFSYLQKIKPVPVPQTL